MASTPSLAQQPQQQQQQGDVDDGRSGGASSMVDSYMHPGFAKFYDTFIDNIPPEYEVSESSALCCMLLERTVRAKHQRIGEQTNTDSELVPITVLDLASGTGRVALSLLQWWFSTAARELVRPFSLQVIANDSSPLMIAEANSKLEQFQQSISTHERRNSYSIRWVEGDMSQLREESIRERVDVVFLCAGSVHHLLTRASQQQLMDNICWHMLPHPDSRAVLNLFGEEEFASYEELNKEAPAAMRTGEYERVHLGRDRENATDHPADIIVHDKYQLIKFKPTSQEDQPSIEWSAREGWSLRSIAHEDFRHLADRAGLRVVHESESFAGVMGLIASRESATGFPKNGGSASESEGYERRSRVFVLGVKGC